MIHLEKLNINYNKVYCIFSKFLQFLLVFLFNYFKNQANNK